MWRNVCLLWHQYALAGRSFHLCPSLGTCLLQDFLNRAMSRSTFVPLVPCFPLAASRPTDMAKSWEILRARFSPVGRVLSMGSSETSQERRASSTGQEAQHAKEEAKNLEWTEAWRNSASSSSGSVINHCPSAAPWARPSKALDSQPRRGRMGADKGKAIPDRDWR